MRIIRVMSESVTSWVYECVEGDMSEWYTVTVYGSPVEGSTDDKAEANGWLARANREDAYDGLASLTVTDHPIAW